MFFLSVVPATRPGRHGLATTLKILLYGWYRIHFRKERRLITPRVKEKGEHLATEGITGMRQGMRKQMMEGRDWREEA